MEYQNSTVEQTVRLCEALAFGLPVSIMRALETVAEFSAAQTQLWWRIAWLPAAAMSAAWANQPGASELDSLAMDIEQIRAELRAAGVERRDREGAVAARLDRLRDELTALRDELNAALAAKSDRTEVDRLRAELSSTREELRGAMAEKEANHAAHAEMLAGLEVELRALRDRMETAPETEPGSEKRRPPNGETSRKRPRR